MQIKRKLTIAFLSILALGLLIPQRGVVPVQHASAKDWHAQSFWYSPWGESGVHKGIDIFAKRGTPVLSNGAGLVLFSGNIRMGGNVVAVLGAKWRIHYYAHLKQSDVTSLNWVSSGETIGQVGNTGNAAGKPPHLHYSVLSLIPYPWRISLQAQGYKKMWFLNPAETFSESAYMA